MKKPCPNCGADVPISQTRCNTCRFTFPAIASRNRSKVKWIIAIAAFAILALIFRPRKAPDVPIQMVKRDSLAVQKTSPKLSRAEQEWEEIKQAETRMPEDARKAEVGVTTTIIGPGASWPCARSKTDLKEMMKWYKTSLDDPDGPNGEAAFSRFSDIMVRTRSSIMLEPRDRVKVLEAEPGIRRLVLVERHKSILHPSKPPVPFVGERAVTAQGCWIASEAVVR